MPTQEGEIPVKGGYYHPLSEDVILYLLYRRSLSSQVFFKCKHNISKDREWYMGFSPDVDFLEVKKNGEIIGYEAKGQIKKKEGYEWPPLYAGLDEAMFYLNLPILKKDGDYMKGGVMDKVYLVHASEEPRAKEVVDIISLTPIGYIYVTPKAELVELLPAKENPLLNQEKKRFFLENLDTLDAYSIAGRSFRRTIEPKGRDYLAQL